MIEILDPLPLVRARRRKALRYVQLAEITGIPIATLCRMLKHGQARPERVKIVAKALGVNPEKCWRVADGD